MCAQPSNLFRVRRILSPIDLTGITISKDISHEKTRYKFTRPLEIRLIHHETDISVPTSFQLLVQPDLSTCIFSVLKAYANPSWNLIVLAYT